MTPILLFICAAILTFISHQMGEIKGFRNGFNQCDELWNKTLINIRNTLKENDETK